MAYSSRYDPDVHIELGYLLAVKGKINTEIAKALGITSRTLRNWMARYPEFKASVQAGKDVVDHLVEGSLLKRALGYDVQEVTKERVKDERTGRIRMMTTKRVHKHVGPDTGAIAFWLKNRRPWEWRDRREIDLSGDLKVKEGTPDLGRLTTGQLHELEKIAEHAYNDDGASSN